MSVKMVLLAAVVGAGVMAVARAQPPVAPASSAPGDSLVVADVSMGERFRYSMGSIGTAIVGGSVRRSVLQNEQTLSDLGKALKVAKGADGVRARKIAHTIRQMDSTAVENLNHGRPMTAMKQSMEARSLLNAVRRNLTQGT